MKKMLSLTCSIGAIAIFFSQLSFSQGTWTQKANFGGTARFGATSFAIGTKGYMGTGYDGTTLFQDFWEYDPQTDVWTQQATFPGMARFVAVGFYFSVGTKAYIGTGWNGSGATDQSDFWQYDAAFNSWTQKASFGGGQRNGAVGFSIGNKGYIGTGWNITTPPIYYHRDFWEYDPQTDTWTRKADFGGPGRQTATGFSIGSKGYIGLGSDGSTYFRDFWEYDQLTDAWTQKTNFPGPGRQWASAFSIGTKGYVGTGGTYPNGPFYFDFYEWNQATDVWTQQTDFGGSARSLASGFSIGTKGYLGTGYDGASQNDFWEFSPASPNPPGSSCATAIDLGRGDTTVSNITMTDSVMWFKFQPDSTSIAVFVSPSNTNVHIDNINLYGGTYNSFSLITSAIPLGGGDTLPAFFATNLNINNYYYLKLKTSNVSNAKFNLSIENRADRIILGTQSGCSSCGMNLVFNGDFENPPTSNQNPYDLYGPPGSGLTYVTSFSPLKTCKYSISKTAVSPHSQSEAVDHTPGKGGNGYFLWGDAPSDNCSSKPYEETVWSQLVPVQQGNFYDFSIWMKDLGVQYTTAWVKLKLQVNGQDLDSWFDNGSSRSWNIMCKRWLANTTGYIPITIRCKGSTNAAGNDFGIDDIEFRATTIITPPTINASATTTCPRGCVTLSIPAGNPCRWTTGETSNSIVVCPTVTTTYQVTVYPKIGCPYDVSATAAITINVVTAPNIAVTNSPPVCMGSAANLSVNTPFPPNTNFSWNFGDPAAGSSNTANGPNVSHSYNNGPGSYVITITGTNTQCGLTTSGNTIVNVVPSTSTYNAGCCSSNPSNYTDVNNIYINSPISSPTDWNGLTNKKIEYDLIIFPNCSLTVRNSTVQFGPLGRIIIQPGGKLTVDNSTLEGLQTCGTMWQGIQVWGDANQTQGRTNPNTNNIYQGKLIMRNNAVIRDAHAAVTLGQPNGASWITLKSGGILDATNSQFSNNGYGIKVFPYQFTEISSVQNCSFQSTALLDPGYDLNNTVGYHYPDANNPSYGLANSSKRTFAHIYILGAKRLRIMDNTLNNAEYGVISANSANWYITNTGSGNRFFKMNNAMMLVNWQSAIFGNRIEYNRFESITPNAYSGWVTIGAAQYDGIRNNLFNKFGPSTQNATMALLMDNCSGFTVNDNEFRLMALGVWAFSSGTAGGTIGFDNVGNTFDHCKTGVRVHGANPALQIKCNNHLNEPSKQPYFLDWYLPASSPAVTLANQGNFGSATPSTHDPAGNEFNQTLPNQFKDIWSTTPFNYLHHDPSNGLSVKPGLNGPVGQVLTTASLFNSGFQKDITTSCFPAPIPCGCNPSCCRLASISNLTTQINSLGIAYNTTLANLDQGQTTQLIAAIGPAGNVALRLAAPGNNADAKQGSHDDDHNNLCKGLPDPEDLEELLLKNSPLSDEVLMAFINRKCKTPPGIFKDVIIRNSPVSDNVRTVLYAKLNSLPLGIANQIKAAQLSAKYSTLTLIGRQSESATIKRQMLINDAVRYYADTNDVDSAIVMLRIENSVQAGQTIAATLIAEGRFAEAQTQLSAMTANSAEEQAFIDLQSMLLNLEQSGKTVFEMDSVQEQLVRQVATMPVSCLARTNARAILFIVFHEQFSDDFQLNSSLRMMQMNPETNEYQFTPKHKYLGENYPNPFNNTTIIPYILPEGDNGVIRIYDVNGKQISSYNLMEGINELQISTNTWNNGVYFYSMELNGSEAEHRKMILIKE